MNQHAPARIFPGDEREERVEVVHGTPVLRLEGRAGNEFRLLRRAQSSGGLPPLKESHAQSPPTPAGGTEGDSTNRNPQNFAERPERLPINEHWVIGGLVDLYTLEESTPGLWFPDTSTALRSTLTRTTIKHRTLVLNSHLEHCTYGTDDPAGATVSVVNRREVANQELVLRTCEGMSDIPPHTA